ncbi:hypothetical protein P3717_25115, partial [Vibrio parahaemolyticus]|nr:hypothetical protein [Vibrio parahaemolyticus]
DYLSLSHNELVQKAHRDAISERDDNVVMSAIFLLRISVIAIARFGLFRSPDPAVFLSSYFYSK